MDKIVGNIYESFDYQKFCILKGNRTINHWKSIVEAVKKFGQLFSPIAVNENYEIIDGQNRFKAFELLNLPIRYYFVDGYGAKECSILNTTGKNWSMSDFIDSYADIGNDNYIWLKSLLNKYKGKLNSTTVCVICSGNLYFSPNGAIKDGTFKPKDKETAERVLDYISKFEFSHVRGNVNLFYQVLAFCCICEQIDNVRMLEQYQKCSYIIDGVTCIKDAAEKIEHMYNYGKQKKTYVYISSLYREEADKRNACSSFKHKS